MLIAVNLMILLSIIRHNNNASIDNPYFSRQNMTNFSQLLEMREISLQVELPREIHTLGSVNAEHRDFNRDNHPDLFEDYDVKTFENSKRISIKLDQSIQFIDEDQYNLLEEGQREGFARHFLADYFPQNQYVQVGNKEPDTLNYKALYEDFVFEESYVTFEFGPKGALITATDIIPRETSASKKKAITSVEAILSALPDLQAGDQIMGIELVYHYDLPEEEFYKVKYVRVFPYWKISTENDTIYTLAF